MFPATGAATSMFPPAEKAVFDPQPPPEDRYLTQYITAFSGILRTKYVGNYMHKKFKIHFL